MALAYDKIMGFKIPDAEQHLTRKDTMLYALGVGLGADPCDTNQLKFVYEKDLEALPTMAIILGYAGNWHAGHPELGITASHTVHGEQGFRILKRLPVEGDGRPSSFDLVTPRYFFKKYNVQNHSVLLASGVEARLIEAEGALHDPGGLRHDRQPRPGADRESGTKLTWTWKVGSSTHPGSWPVTVDCGSSGTLALRLHVTG